MTLKTIVLILNNLNFVFNTIITWRKPIIELTTKGTMLNFRFRLNIWKRTISSKIIFTRYYRKSNFNTGKKTMRRMWLLTWLHDSSRSFKNCISFISLERSLSLVATSQVHSIRLVNPSSSHHKSSSLLMKWDKEIPFCVNELHCWCILNTTGTLALLRVSKKLYQISWAILE